jgi:hypothetical protein
MVVELDRFGQGRAQVRRHLAQRRGVAQLAFERLACHLIGADPGPHPLGQDIVPAQLVDDRPLDPGCGIGGELKAPGGVESFNGID